MSAGTLGHYWADPPQLVRFQGQDQAANGRLRNTSRLVLGGTVVPTARAQVSLSLSSHSLILTLTYSLSNLHTHTLSLSLSTMYDADERRDEWLEEIYENQARYPLSSWPDESKSYWTNVV